jgi:hypothetical protein
MKILLGYRFFGAAPCSGAFPDARPLASQIGLRGIDESPILKGFFALYVTRNLGTIWEQKVPKTGQKQQK